MTYTPVATENFSGLNLIDDPGSVGWSGAIDLLNVEFDQRGRVHTRDGYAKFTTAAAAGSYHALAPFYTSSGTKQLIAAFGGASGAINALNTSGGIVAAQAFVNSTYASIARFGGPTTEVAYVAVSGSGAATVYRWNGAAWATPGWTGTAPTGRHLATTSDFRVANARRNGTTAGDNPSTVRFSDAGLPETWGANNYVDVTPGDGEEITALATWRDLLFAFKETKFAVFYGNSTDSSGNPVFNDRMVTSQGLAGGAGSSAYRAIAVAPNGVYFANRRGIWFTDGGPGQLISRQVDPIFRGNPSSFFGSSSLNQAQISLVALLWHDEKLWFAFPSGSSTTNDRVLRFDPVTGNWSLYDMPASAMASFRIGNSEELVFAFSGTTLALGVPSTLEPSLSSTAGTLTNNQAYFYKVTALNASGETTGSSEVTNIARVAPGTPASPSGTAVAGGSLPNSTYNYNIVAVNGSSIGATSAKSSLVSVTTTGSNGTVSLTWSGASGTPTSYRVYRSSNITPAFAYYDVGNVTSWSDDGSVSSWITGVPPTVATSYQSITVSWTAVTGATSYRVYRGTTAGGESVFFAPGNVVTFTDTGTAGTAGTVPVSNTATTAGFDVARHSSSYTSDGGDGTTTGAAITSRYRSGFSDLGAPEQKTIREWVLDGIGSPTFQASHDFGSLETGAAVTLGTSPAISEGRYRVARRGRQFSWQIGGTAAWALNNLTANVREKRKPGVHASA